MGPQHVPPNIHICDTLSENLALPANTDFELEWILPVQVVFQLNSDYITNVSQGACHCIILNYEARCHQKISTPNFWHPCSNNPRIRGTPIPIFLGLWDSTFDLPLEIWHPQA